MKFRGAALLFLCSTSGCSLFGGVRVETLASGAERPGNVAAYVAVTDGGEPVTTLAESNFVLYEDEVALNAQATREVLLASELVATHRALLLVDVSLASTAEARATLARAVQAFVEKVRVNQAVSVFAFDGEAALKPIGEYPQAESGSVDTQRLTALRVADSSRNLNGAMLRAVKELDTRLAQSRKTVRIGTLVVFASGADLAKRADISDVDQTLDAHDFAVLAVGVGQKAPSEVQGLGRDGYVAAQSADTLPIAFEEAAYKVRSQYEKHYLVAYCSPSRAGKRKLRIEVRYFDKKGDERKGDTEVEFDAQGFSPGCDAERLPRLTANVRKAEKSPDKKPASSPRPGSTEKSSGAKSSEALPGGDVPKDETNGGGQEEGPVVPPPKRPGYAP